MSQTIREFERELVRPHYHKLTRKSKLVPAPSWLLKRTVSFTRHCGVRMLRVQWLMNCVVDNCRYAEPEHLCLFYCTICHHLTRPYMTENCQ